MAAKKAKKQAQSNGDKQKTGNGAEGASAAAAQPATKIPSKKAARRRSRPPGKKTTRRAGRPPKAAGTKARARRKAARTSGVRKRFSDSERRTILATAQREGLTGAQIAKRFGISQVTYYLWKKKAGGGARRRVRAEAAAATVGRTLGRAMNLGDMIREESRKRIGQLLPEIVSSEVGSAMSGSIRRRGRPRG